MTIASSAGSLIDTHAHLDDQSFEGDVGQVIARAGAVGVNRIINIGYRPAIWRTTIALAQKYPQVSFTLGLHPNHVDEDVESIWPELRRLVGEVRPVAIGEIGLDYFRNYTSKAAQRRTFDRQLAIAADAKLPVVIHQRDAEADLMQFLSAPTAILWILHSFDGSQALADAALAAGCHFGVGGLMTKAGSSDLREVLKSLPLDRLLLETDSPYLVPRGIKNRRNEPSNVPVVVQALAELKGISIELVALHTTRNAERVFGLSSAEKS